MKKILAATLIFLWAAGAVQAAVRIGTGAHDLVVLETSRGAVTFRLFPEVAPKHVANFKKLIREGYYDGLYFHDVVKGLVQSGDAELRGRQPYTYIVESEPSALPPVRGALGMARRPVPEHIHLMERESGRKAPRWYPGSDAAQFFILTQDAPGTKGEFTLFGQVESNMAALDNLKMADKIYRAYILREHGRR